VSALGSAALIAALVVAVYAAVAALIGTRGDRRWVVSARRAIYALLPDAGARPVDRAMLRELEVAARVQGERRRADLSSTA